MEPANSNWLRILRPRGKGFRADLVWAVAVLAGAAVAAAVFDGWDGFLGAVVGVIFVLIARAVLRGLKS